MGSEDTALTEGIVHGRHRPLRFRRASWELEGLSQIATGLVGYAETAGSYAAMVDDVISHGGDSDSAHACHDSKTTVTVVTRGMHGGRGDGDTTVGSGVNGDHADSDGSGVLFAMTVSCDIMIRCT